MDLVSPNPFWPQKDGTPATYPSLRKNARCDVAVLGAGISGALVAELLAREGLSVVVLDKRDAARGSTSASTALIQYEIDTSLSDLSQMIGTRDAGRAYRLCHQAIDGIDRLAKRFGDECVFTRKKSLYLASAASDVPGLHKEFTARKAAGIAVEYLEATDIESRFSFRRPGALLSHKAGEMDCYRMAHALLRSAKAAGARIFDKTTIAEYDAGPDAVRLKTDTGCTVQAKHVVFATGYEAQEFLPQKVVNLKSTYALASEPLRKFPGWWKRCLIWETARPYLYLRTTSDNRALIGGEDDPFRDPERRDSRVPAKTRRLEKKFRELFPRIPLEVSARWAGTFGETKDGLAYIGSIRQMPRSFFALGFGGNGIVYSHIAARLIRDALFQRRNADARLFRFDRQVSGKASK